MDQELIDVLDSNGSVTGEKKTRQEIHERGLWHCATDLWFLNFKGELLINLRSPLKDNNPNKWDVSSGGHVRAGEDVRAGVLREIKEEFELELGANDLVYLGTVKIETERPGYINREFNPVFIVKIDFKPENIKKQDSEVAAIKWLPWSELQKTVESHDPNFVPHEEEYKILFKYLKENNY
ncbi:MAG TPA: NUDIX domain-containing protein [bacterium]|nr:NUDIX domain-containing protein [bacterium]HPL95746.1 NUDIX domain-containing protein [bacterium]